MKRVFIIIILFIFSCNLKEEKQVHLSKSDYQEKMIASHKAHLAKERERINEFILSTGLSFEETQTGLRYHIFSRGSKDSIKVGEVAIVDYVLTLVNGDTAYTTLETVPQQFAVEFDNVENGLHEGIQKMAIGDSSILILPAHLGHGITGDQAEIPSQSILVYYLKFLAKLR